MKKSALIGAAVKLRESRDRVLRQNVSDESKSFRFPEESKFKFGLISFFENSMVIGGGE